jgi:hypothetical protein
MPLLHTTSKAHVAVFYASGPAEAQLWDEGPAATVIKQQCAHDRTKCHAWVRECHRPSSMPGFRNAIDHLPWSICRPLLLYEAVGGPNSFPGQPAQLSFNQALLFLVGVRGYGAVKGSGALWSALDIATSMRKVEHYQD